MAAGDKDSVKPLLSYFFEKLFFFLSTVPNKAEISADNQSVSFFQLFDFGFLKTAELAVKIAGDINHSFSPSLSFALFTRALDSPMQIGYNNL